MRKIGPTAAKSVNFHNGSVKKTALWAILVALVAICGSAQTGPTEMKMQRILDACLSESISATSKVQCLMVESSPGAGRSTEMQRILDVCLSESISATSKVQCVVKEFEAYQQIGRWAACVFFLPDECEMPLLFPLPAEEQRLAEEVYGRCYEDHTSFVKMWACLDASMK